MAASVHETILVLTFYLLTANHILPDPGFKRFAGDNVRDLKCAFFIASSTQSVSGGTTIDNFLFKFL